MGLMMISSTSVFAQASFGVKAGLNLSKMSGKAEGEKLDDIKMKPGFNIGAFADFSFSDMFALETGLTIETKGFKIKNEEEMFGGNLESKTTFNVVYATIPVQARLNFSNFYVLAGPYIGIGVTGKLKTKVTYDGETEKEDDSIEFGDDAEESDLKRLDFGLGVGAGYEITDNFGVRLGYDLGLANLTPGGDKDNKLKNGSINLSVTFKF